MSVGSELVVGAAILLCGCRSDDSSTAAASSLNDVNVAAGVASQVPFANSNASGRELVLYVEGLTCEGCAWQIREALQKVDGIIGIQTTVATKRVVIKYDPQRVTAAAARQALDQVGYESAVVRE